MAHKEALSGKLNPQPSSTECREPSTQQQPLKIVSRWSEELRHESRSHDFGKFLRSNLKHPIFLREHHRVVSLHQLKPFQKIHITKANEYVFQDKSVLGSLKLSVN